ncbi:hypothetical protein FE257_001483 [Aspergillus nanangensis]|uniref:Transcription factor domain-containing protein n=1 Tax=Aspergillus nanangensis TaxID=2582783 RepID=A0AAD4CEV8_ASPNN|nr:hypothetical protein FE257_001483 [Aspergillus nanangensis]
MGSLSMLMGCPLCTSNLEFARVIHVLIPKDVKASRSKDVAPASPHSLDQTDRGQAISADPRIRESERVPEDTSGASIPEVGHESRAADSGPSEQIRLQRAEDLYFRRTNPVERVLEPWTTMRHSLSTPEQKTLEVWNSWRFVKAGLISAQEAVTYVDLFFQNMGILSPSLHNYYQDHSKHHDLIAKEPVLCCTIIALSSRYHMLAGDGGISRGFYIHARMWKACQSMFQRIVWDQRRAVKDQIRHLGTIESLLLVTEWHPRSAHLPMENDYGQIDFELSIDEEVLCHNKVPNKWLQEVEETAQRSDRMSWMLLGGALTLGHELDLFDGRSDPPVPTTNTDTGLSFANFLILRRGRLRRLLFVYISQLASRIGCALPRTPFHDTILSSIRQPSSILDRQWHDSTTSWIELSRLIRTSSEFLFPSKYVTQELLHSGRYTEFLEHFQPLLSRWLEDYKTQSNVTLPHYLLLIDYHFVRLYINSLSLQAAAGRMGNDDEYHAWSHHQGTRDDGFVREVITGSKAILEMVSRLASGGQLKYIPVRIYIRIASASIHLINALALGVRKSELDESLLLLDHTVEVLYSNSVDDVHLGFRYASLLRNQTKGLRERFVRVERPISSWPVGFYDADLVTNTSSSTFSAAGFNNDIRHPSLTSQGSQLASDPNVSLEVPILEPRESAGENTFLQNGMSTAGASVSHDDWFALPFNSPTDGFGNTFLYDFFEIDPTDARLDKVATLSSKLGEMLECLF